MQPTICLSLLLLMAQVLCGVNGTADVAMERGMRWCGDFCLCPANSDVHIQCMNASDIYDTLEFGRIQVMRLNRVRWNPITALKWCNAGNCFCNKETDKQFACSTDHSIVANFIDEAAETLAAMQTTDQEATEAPILRTAGGPSFQVEEAEDEEASHRRRDSDEERRNRRRNRKNRKNNRRRNRNDEGIDEEASSQEMHLNSDDSEVFDSNPRNDFDYQDSSMLPRQEAINSNPMVTAMQPPTRRQPIYHATTQPSVMQHHNNHVGPTREAFGPQVQESSHPDFQHQQEPRPSLEVPVQRKTVAGRVSEDLKQITEDVQHIRSDVVFNQRILLVTVGVAGVAMLGVLVLALHACCSRRSSSRRARITENGRHEDSHHLHHPSSTVTKVNIDEAW